MTRTLVLWTYKTVQLMINAQNTYISVFRDSE